MKITTAGSLGNVAKPLVEKLLAAGHQLTVITSNADHQGEIEALGAVAAVGSISDAGFLTQAFDGAEAVFAMLPPAMGATNLLDNIAAAGQAYAQAIAAAGVPRVVLLSSVGADAAAGTGPIQGVHRVEQAFRQLTGVGVTVLRSGFFYVNFLRDIPLIKSQNLFGNNYGGDTPLALTHPQDVAAAAAQELQTAGHGYGVKYVVGAVATGQELAALFGAAIGKPDLAWTVIPDEQLQQGLLAAGTPAELVGLITEMGQGVRAGRITQDFFAHGAPVTGPTKLAEFAQEFKARYEQA
ncbi:NmrA family NAD(P)-binding protein [Hymenobacter coccineus]|uniref:NAD-dependent dehydratase n=1 Tax=Hymenobacter coccineus TaxID=1908235 RepID=A0A1G1TAN9_9BACT|nr:NmrA family NAD(P)-binding protein [Hymenobacter coccineus]OGX87948.1 NAD-dependent dehydratase [Hymenobacter coccineus]